MTGETAGAFGDGFVLLHHDEAALIADMLAMMTAVLGVGLSAPQKAVLRVVPELTDPALSAELAAVITSQLQHERASSNGDHDDRA